MKSGNVETNEPNRLSGLLLACSLSLVLLAGSYGRILGDSQSMLFRTSTLDSLMASQFWGTALARNVILFALAMILTHLMFGLACWVIARMSAVGFGTARARLSQYIWLWFLFMTAGALAANAAHFPRSSLGEPYAELMTTRWGPLALGDWIACLVLAAAVSTVLLALFRLWRNGQLSNAVKIGLAAGCIALAAIPVALRPATDRMPAGERPNVILIGLDSLRHDLIDPQTTPNVTPAISGFFANATWFSDAITPLARTFPSMTSLLTGRQPHQTGAFMNLLPRDMIREGDTLGRIFGRAGYHSIYATDEVRFSNIDQSYGFDQIITPPIGSSEFLITLIADTPISNLVVNTSLGRLLFPHLHANRGAAKTYDPAAFNARIEREAELSQPFFLTTHLTLAHWPYTWANAPLVQPDEARWPAYYLNVARRVDEQFAALLSWLESRGALENAIVVVYSDHGEAFGRQGESLAPEKDALLTSLGALPVWGHGVSVLSPHQYRVLLGMRGYGAMAGRIPSSRSVNAAVTLMDVAPTLVELTGAKTETPFSGVSLASLLNENPTVPTALQARVRFTETEYAPINLANQDGKVSKSALGEATRLYHIDPRTDRLEVKRNRTQYLLRIRQYAAFGEELLLAAIPGSARGRAILGGGPSHSFLVISRKGGLPRRLTAIPDKDSPEELQRLWHALYAQFGEVLPAQDFIADVAIGAVAARGQ